MATGNGVLVFTIFGGTGDLTYRKLLPAFYNLLSTNQLPKNSKIVIVGRRDYTQKDYLELILPWVKQFARLPFDQDTFNHLSKHLIYVKMDFKTKSDYQRLGDVYQTFGDHQQRIYYLAVAPNFFGVISDHLKQSKLLSDEHQHQVMIEKPFGVDILSAQILHTRLLEAFKEQDIYRIDHYLGKEMIQNIFTLRFQNKLFEGVWNKDFIDYIQISAMETVGVENRGAYYDQTGALKDMVQNHLFQILSIVLMNQPKSNDSQAFFDQQTKVIDALVPLTKTTFNQHVVLGQYTQGFIENSSVRAYRQEESVAADSLTETYVALKVYVDLPNWHGVPIYLRTGKRSKDRSTEVVIAFKPVGNQQPNILIIKISPDEGVYLRFNAKKPGITQDVVPVFMDFCQSCVYENRLNTPEAYERLLNAAIGKDRTLFTDWNMVLSSWSYIDHVVALIDQLKPKVYPYASGKDGPSESSEIFQSNHHWLDANMIYKTGETYEQ